MRFGMMCGVIGTMTSVGLGGGEALMDNAALEYHRAWLITDDALSDALITSDEELGLEKGAIGALEAAQDGIELVLGASRIREADWEVSFEDWPLTLMPHLGKMRRSAKALTADALRCVEQGDLDGAAERAAALYRMAVHVTEGDILICSLVGMAMGNLANDLTGQLIEDGVLDAARAGMVLRSIEGGDAEDRYSMREAIIGEWRIMSEVILRQSGDDAGKKLIEGLMLDAGSGPAKEVAAMDRAELLRSLGGFAAYHGDLLDAWNSGSMRAMRSAEQRLEDGDYGAVARLLGATLTRAFDSDQESRRQLEALIGRLEEISD